MAKNRALAAKALRARRERGRLATDLALAEIVAGRTPDRTPVVPGVNVPVTYFAPHTPRTRERTEKPRTELLARGAIALCQSDDIAPRLYRRVNGRLVAA